MYKEIWKDVKGYEGEYQVSNLGKVKNIKKDNIIKGTINKNGYIYVDLWKNNKRHKKTIHRLVAENFLNNINNYTDVNHKDGNKQNNKLSNLEFCTRSYNIKEAYRLGLKKKVYPMMNKKGKYCPNSKKVIQYDLQGNIIKIWDSMMDIERELKIHHSNISACCLKVEHHKTIKGYKWGFLEVDND